MDVLAVTELGESIVATEERGQHMAVSLSVLSDSPKGIVGGLAFVVFNPRTGQASSHYSRTIDWEQEGRSFNFAVIQSLLNQSTLARKAVTTLTGPVALPEAVRALVQAYTGAQCTALWGTASDLATLASAADFSKMPLPMGKGEMRDIAAVWATALDLGIAPDMARGDTEPKGVPLGEAAFIARGVSALYQRQSGPHGGVEREFPAGETQHVSV